MYKHYIECCIIYFSCSAAALIENSVERIHVTIVSIGTYTVLFLVITIKSFNYTQFVHHSPQLLRARAPQTEHVTHCYFFFVTFSNSSLILRYKWPGFQVLSMPLPG